MVVNNKNLKSTATTLTVYSTPHCVYCGELKKYLSKKGVEFKEVDLSNDKEALAAFRAKRHFTVPLMEAGEETLSGFNEKDVETFLKKNGLVK